MRDYSTVPSFTDSRGTQRNPTAPGQLHCCPTAAKKESFLPHVGVTKSEEYIKAAAEAILITLRGAKNSVPRTPPGSLPRPQRPIPYLTNIFTKPEARPFVTPTQSYGPRYRSLIIHYQASNTPYLLFPKSLRVRNEQGGR